MDGPDTSSEVQRAYWKARVILRDIAMRAYGSVLSYYNREEIRSLDLPSEGFKEIARDCTEQMNRHG